MKARDSFVANVTHELRTPVNGIKGHTELLLEKEEDFQKQNYLKHLSVPLKNMLEKGRNIC